MQPIQTHKFTLQGITGIAISVILFIGLGTVYFFITQFNSLVDFYPLPFLYFKYFIAGISLLVCLFCFYTIIYLNKYRAKKQHWYFNSAISKTIQKVFWITLFLSVVAGVLLIHSNYLELVIPASLLTYGVFCITVNKLTHGNSFILGLFFVLQSFLAVLFTEAAFLLAVIAFILFHVVYAFFRRHPIKHHQHNPANI